MLALRHFEQLTNSEIAQVLHISEGAASNRFVRALERLKNILASASDLLEARSKVGPAKKSPETKGRDKNDAKGRISP